MLRLRWPQLERRLQDSAVDRLKVHLLQRGLETDVKEGRVHGVHPTQSEISWRQLSVCVLSQFFSFLDSVLSRVIPDKTLL